MRIVMTGATSGIGLAAAERILDAGASLTIGARNPDRLPVSLKNRVTALSLDLADLHEVERFAATIKQDEPIDALVLNAGVNLGSLRKSAQGHELTCATNHLAHFALLNELLPSIASGGRIVVTSSGTHDPAERTGVAPPLHADLAKLANPESDPAREANMRTAMQRAYSASKLCNLLMVRELTNRTAAVRPDIAIIAFDPALTPGTGMGRGHNAFLAFVFRHILPFIVRGDHVSSPSLSGGYLSELVLDPHYSGQRGAYFSVRAKRLMEKQPSALASDQTVAAKLWDDSLTMVAASKR